MYCRMMMVSRRLQEAIDDGATGKLVEEARTQLYRASATAATGTGPSAAFTCRTCATPSISTLIAADNLLDRLANRPETWVEAAADDYNFDARQEVRLANDRLMALVVPSRGGMLAELDVRRIRHNLLATLARQPEAYHRKVLAGANQPERQLRQHPRPRRVQAARPRPADPVRRLPAEEPLGSLLRQRGDARGRGVGPGRRAERFRAGQLRSPHPPQSRPHPGAVGPRRHRPAACRCGSPRA